ncbi:MAG TPA: putative DNA-binding domain-containing protein, partial [Kofleriaceae bacterium]|nr:putative DNA-binding domain-containing protein [Kofleriaceae bacterium]
MAAVTLAEIQHVLHGLLGGRAELRAVAEILGVDPARLGIYQDFVAGHVRSVLDKNYVYLRRLLEPAMWDALTREYFLAQPSRDWELNQAARGFGDFLEVELEAERPGIAPFHAVLAAFEWEELATYLSETELPASVDGRVANPTLSVLELPYDIPGFIEAHPLEEMTPATPLPPL